MACARFLFSVTLLKEFLDKRTLIAAGATKLPAPRSLVRLAPPHADFTIQITYSESFLFGYRVSSFFLIPPVVWPTNQRDKTCEELREGEKERGEKSDGERERVRGGEDEGGKKGERESHLHFETLLRRDNANPRWIIATENDPISK